MKTGQFDRKNICKNGNIPAAKKYITTKDRKTPDIAAVWGEALCRKIRQREQSCCRKTF